MNMAKLFLMDYIIPSQDVAVRGPLLCSTCSKLSQMLEFGIHVPTWWNNNILVRTFNTQKVGQYCVRTVTHICHHYFSKNIEFYFLQYLCKFRFLLIL